MADELYFQWQNEVLRKSIYPLREMKLRDFLVYYKEIELWKEYKKKDVSGEVDDYLQKKKQAVEKAVNTYFDQKKYFMSLNVEADYKEYMKDAVWLEQEVFTAIINFHKSFHDYLDNYKDKPRHEAYFLSQRVVYWLDYRKGYLKKVASKQRRVDAMKMETPSPANLSVAEQELTIMKDRALKMIDVELERLYAFVSASGRIEKRKQDIVKAVEAAEKIVKDARLELEKLGPKIEAQEYLQKQTSDGLARLKSPPKLASVEAYFSVSDISAQIHDRFVNAGESLIDSIGGFRREMQYLLKSSKSVPTSLKVIQNAIDSLLQYRKDIQKEILKHETDLNNMGKDWVHKSEREALRDNLRDVSLKVVDEEMGRLADYQVAFEHSKKSKDEWKDLIKAKRKELDSVKNSLLKLHDEKKVLLEEIDLHDDILIVTDDIRLKEFVLESSAPVTSKDIVQARIDEYKSSLLDLDHYQLLTLVVNELRSKPDRYPRWLQYMVIHFSGMRYASAHGSWADPRDLLANLRASKIEQKEIKDLNDDEVEKRCEEKLEYYDPGEKPPVFTEEKMPKLAQASDPEWKDRIADHVRQIRRAGSPYHKRQALLNLRIDEDSYEIDVMETAEVYEELMTYKGILPDWMWKEIVRLTDLRVTEVKDENWEKPAQGPSVYTKQDLELRTMLEEWKKDSLTAWREEHDRSEGLVVSRAVCNEVAEHIQHLRGLTPPGGLTSKPTWYQSIEKTNSNSFFVKPENEDDFKPGASILWLRFVRKQPNEWQVAHPIAPKGGNFELLPQGFKIKRPDGPNGTTPWTYVQGDLITRSRTFQAADGGRVRQEEWLRWMHEATVVETAETADGDVVLTFETALPGDDPRMATIGVFKRRLHDLTDDGDEDAYHRSFIGYIPEGKVPEENLKGMLDWDKILLKPVVN